MVGRLLSNDPLLLEDVLGIADRVSSPEGLELGRHEVDALLGVRREDHVALLCLDLLNNRVCCEDRLNHRISVVSHAACERRV